MDRNKVIYALGDWALVVASDYRKGGTWAGAKEDLDAGWVPLLVRSSEDASRGLRGLIEMGATPIAAEALEGIQDVLAAASLREGTPGPVDDSGGEQMSLL